MTYVALIVFGTVLLFGFVVFFGAPYLPTLKKQQETALDLLSLRPGQALLELGCGDGKVLVAAAKRGIRVTGYELNPILAGLAWLRTRRFGKNVKVVWGDYWRKDWPSTDGIFVFLLDKYMERLDKKIIQRYPRKQVKLVSFAFQVPGKRPEKVQDGLYLYRYETLYDQR